VRLIDTETRRQWWGKGLGSGSGQQYYIMA